MPRQRQQPVRLVCWPHRVGEGALAAAKLYAVLYGVYKPGGAIDRGAPGGAGKPAGLLGVGQ